MTNQTDNIVHLPVKFAAKFPEIFAELPAPFDLSDFDYQETKTLFLQVVEKLANYGDTPESLKEIIDFLSSIEEPDEEF